MHKVDLYNTFQATMRICNTMQANENTHNLNQNTVSAQACLTVDYSAIRYLGNSSKKTATHVDKKKTTYI